MITIENLCKAYNDKILFKNFHLEIPDSRFLVISGESGCGKSTLLNMIGGIETPDKGSIIVNGFDVAKKGKKQKYFKEVVGFLFQNFALLENKTVKENLEIIKKSGRTDISINEALEKVGLQKVINKKVYQLSGGEQQRVALARLMLKKCSIVLADEPTGSLDKKNSEIVMNILHELSEQGKTVIVVTHSEEIVAQEKHVLYLSLPNEKYLYRLLGLALFQHLQHQLLYTVCLDLFYKYRPLQAIHP